MLQLQDLTIRLGEVGDLAFIQDAWAKSLSKTYPNQYQFDFLSRCHQQIKYLIDKSVIVCQVLDDSPEDIVSFLVYTSFRQQMVVLYAYTRQEERRQGFLNELLAFANPEQHPLIFISPCKNENVMRYFASKYVFDPTILRVMELPA